MRILHLIDSLDYGGAETLLMSYIPLLKEDEHFIATLVPVNVYPKTNYTYLPLNVNPTRGFLRAVMAIRKIIRVNKIDLVHSHSYWTNIISRVATPGRVKLINHYHFADYDTMINKRSVKVMLLIDKWLSHKRLIRIAVSNYLGQVLRKKFTGAKIKVIPNYIQCKPATHRDQCRKNEYLKVIAVGNCNAEKNYGLILEAFSMLQDTPVSLDIYGGGEQLEFFRNEVKRLQLGNVRFCGSSPEIGTKLKEYDLFLSASLSETFGMVVLEAICAKLPLLIAEIPAFREIAPSQTVFFNPMEKDDLVLKLKQLQKTGANADYTEYDSILQKYSADHFITRLKKLYQRSLCVE